MSIKRKRKLLSKSVKSLAEVNKENEKLEKKLALIKEGIPEVLDTEEPETNPEEIIKPIIDPITEEQDLPNSNFTLVSFATDANGNRVVRLKNNTSGKKFSIQTNGNLPKTHRQSIADVKVDDLTPEEIAEVSKEVVDFVSNYGTKAQKTGLLGEVSESVVEEEIVTEDTEIDLNDPENIDFKNGLLEIIEYYEAELQSGETSDPEMIAMIEDEIKGAKEWLDNGFIPSNGLEEEAPIEEATKLDEPTRTVFTVQGDNIVRINQFSEEEQEENMVFLSFDSIKKMAEELNP